MTVYFTFIATDQFVSGGYGLSGPEIAEVTVWQDELLGYTFSFHTGHDKGWPVYITQGTGKQMSKINLKGVVAGGVAFIDNKSVNKQQKENAVAVVTANLAAFQGMAERFYGGIEVATASVTLSACCPGRHLQKEVPEMQESRVN